MSLFLTNLNGERSYEQLLLDINATKYYYRALIINDLYSFFLNFIVGLISNKPLILLDSDLSSQEIDRLGIKDHINTKTFIIIDCIESFEVLIELVKKSESEIIIFTSGTTGQPKKIIHSVSSLIKNVRFTESNDSFVWGLAYNPTHIAGLQVFFQSFLNKNPIINLFNASRTLILETINKYQITHISATPTFFRLLFPIEDKYDSVVRLTFGGEKSDKKLFDKMLQVFPNAKINNIYASTEAGTLLISNGDIFKIPDNLSGKIIIVDEELLIHKSLLGKSDKFELSNNYYHSNDIIEWVDESKGLFRFKSRKNELLNIGGYKVNPIEVEEIILEYTSVLQAFVYSKPSSILGNILCADVQLIKDTSVSEIELRLYLKSKLQDFKVPRIIKFVDNFELTRTGKLKRV